MTAPTASLPAAEPGWPARPGLAARWRARGRAAPVWPIGLAAAVIVFWWGATGVLLALQHSAGTRALALALAAGAAAGGMSLAARARRAAGSGAGARAVLAGALLWTAVSAAFYGGWVVGPVARAAAGARPGAAPTLARAAAAVTATGYSSLLAAALLALAWAVARRPGRAAGAAPGFAPGTFAVLWAAHELAKLNVFAGVANGGAELLPGYLAPLRAFFGPARNAWLLAPSVAALAGAALAAAWAAARAPVPARRAGFALVAGALALAALEHALLGVATPVGWWDAFLRWRGAA